MQQFPENLVDLYGAPLAILAGAAALAIILLALIRATRGATEFDPALDETATDREPGL